MIKIALLVFGIVLIIFSSLLSVLVCRLKPKMLWLFCLISAVVAFVTTSVLIKG